MGELTDKQMRKKIANQMENALDKLKSFNLFLLGAVIGITVTVSVIMSNVLLRDF